MKKGSLIMVTVLVDVYFSFPEPGRGGVRRKKGQEERRGRRDRRKARQESEV
jgi:hypothetical protein